MVSRKNGSVRVFLRNFHSVSVGKWKIYCHWKKISSNQLFSNFFSKHVIFTKFLPKMCEMRLNCSNFHTVHGAHWAGRNFREINFLKCNLVSRFIFSPKIFRQITTHFSNIFYENVFSRNFYQTLIISSYFQTSLSQNYWNRNRLSDKCIHM